MANIAELIDPALLEQEIAEKYIKVGLHPVSPLRILNYTAATMFDKRWNEATEQCRGLIIDADGIVVARPWRKFYNLGEKATLIGSHDTVEITDKADGSLGIGYKDLWTGGGKWFIATRGSFVSDQAHWATEWLGNTFPGWNPEFGYTPLFEIVYPENRIVLDYGDYEGLILLGAIDNLMGHTYGPLEAAGLLCWPGRVTTVFPETTMAEFMSGPNANRSNAEGVVVRSGHRMVKVKQADYVAAHAVVTGLSNRSVWENLSDGYGVPEQASFMPDEFYRWLINTASALTDAKAAWQTEAVQEYDRIFNNAWHVDSAPLVDRLPVGKPTRKTFASMALNSPFSAALFKMYDNQSIEEMAWQAVRPVNFERPFNRPEATA